MAVIRAYAESLRAEKGLSREQASSLDTRDRGMRADAKDHRAVAHHHARGGGAVPRLSGKVDLRAVACGVAETLAGGWPSGNIACGRGAEGLTLNADQSLITEMLLNLVENAIKYGKPGGMW